MAACLLDFGRQIVAEFLQMSLALLQTACSLSSLEPTRAHPHLESPSTALHVPDRLLDCMAHSLKWAEAQGTLRSA